MPWSDLLTIASYIKALGVLPGNRAHHNGALTQSRHHNCAAGRWRYTRSGWMSCALQGLGIVL